MRVSLADADQVIIVRAWREPHDDGSKTCEWRGRVLNVTSRSEQHFVGRAALVTLIQQMLSDQVNDQPAKTESRK